MKNILKAVSLFAVVLLVSFAIVSCSSKDPITGIYVPPPNPSEVITSMLPLTENGQTAEETQEVINSVNNTSTDLPSTDYEIIELRFGSYHVGDANPTITIDGNGKTYSPIIIGIKKIATGHIAYFAISDDSQWTLTSSNNAVSKENGKLTTSDSFYSDSPADISLTVTYKELTEEPFNFTLATDAVAPAPQFSLEGTWEKDNTFLTFNGNTYTQEKTIGDPMELMINGNLVEITKAMGTFSLSGNELSITFTSARRVSDGQTITISGSDSLMTITITIIDNNHFIMGNDVSGNPFERQP
ncbi:MAG: hypothetical protein LBV16_04790 [Elusimicrobiota bacterium]|jgi:hypothetical protein|nr:hypothetical protein [Elusimicrobiota bacterium]